jgi:acyl-CoA reductase-like NAD-dependent aldehyde dehydrogenase
MMMVLEIGPALTIGNAMVLKPAEQTSLTAIRFGELALDAGAFERHNGHGI